MDKKKKKLIIIVSGAILVLLLWNYFSAQKFNFSKNVVSSTTSMIALQTSYEEDFTTAGYTLDNPNIIVKSLW